MSDRARLEAEILSAMSAARERPMQWGRDDCALWCADILRAVVGYDAAADFRGRYTTKRGARRALGKGGLPAGLKRAARRHGWVRIPADHAQPGDIGLIVTAAAVSTVICRKRGWFVGRDVKGYMGVPAHKVRVAWSIDKDDVIDRAVRRSSFPRLPVRPAMTPTSALVHEPVSTALAIAALTSVGIPATATAVAVTSAIITTTIAVGLSFAASLLTPKPTGAGAGGFSSLSGATDGAINVQYTERQAIPFKRVVVGKAYESGALFFEQVIAPYLYMGLLLSEGTIAGVDNVWIGTNKLSFQSLSFNSVLTPLAVDGQAAYSSYLQVSLRAGQDQQAIDPLIASDFASKGIDSNFRQQGIATAVFRYHYGGIDNSAATQASHTALWGQVQRPNAYLLIRGVPVYDPRDPTQRLDDEATWKWSNNASLIQAWYLTRSFGGRIPTSKIKWDKVAEAADWDDEVVSCADGTFQKRYTADGVITLNQKPSDVLSQLLTANRGYVLQSGGMYWVSSSKPRTPIATIHDGILVGAFADRGAKPKTDMINKLQVRGVAQEQDYQTIDGPILERTDFEAADQETLTGTLELPFSLDARRWQRLQKAFLLTSRLGKQVTCTIDIAIMADLDDELIGNAVTVDSDLFPNASGTYLVTSVAFADDCTTLALVLTEYDPAIETDWNPSVDEQTFAIADPFTL